MGSYLGIESLPQLQPKEYDFPKVELHCHLDGCYRVETIAELGKKRGVKLPSYDPDVLREYITVSKPCSSLEEYLENIAIASVAFAGDAEALTRITKEAIQDKVENETAYIELRYSPQYFANCDVEPVVYCAERGRLRPKDVIEVINAAIKESEYEYGIKVRTILCCVTLHHEWDMQVAELCREFQGQGVVGIDVAGPEIDFSEELVKAFEFCRQHGIHRTAHAGEVGPGSRVRKAVTELHAERIGHGYHAVEDKEAYEMAKNHVMHMEVCPLSSHFTSAVKGPWKAHPARRFFADGVDFSLSTDDPAVHQSQIVGDYNIATKEWLFTIKDLQNLNLNAARASFLNEEERRQLVADLKRQYDEFNKSEHDVADLKRQYDEFNKSEHD